MNKRLFLGLLAVLAVLTISAVGIQWTDRANNETTITTADALLASDASIYRYSWTDATVTGTNNDTFLIPTLLYSQWAYNHTLDIAVSAGTPSVVAILQESNTNTGTDWYEVERDTSASISSAAQIRLHGGSNTALGYVKGRRQRIVFDIYSGTGDTLVVSPNTTLKKY